jgi:hypothetical protein
VPTKVIAPGGVEAPRTIVAVKNRARTVAAGICNQARADRIADIVIEPLELRVDGRQGNNDFG